MGKLRRMGKTVYTVLLLFLIVSFVVPFAVQAKEETQRTVRVGWHEAPYFIRDQYGRESGYSYEYQRKVAAYTGWKYEYVEGNWSEVLQKLKKGEIDVLANVSYSEKRAKEMLFTSLPMGTETYYVFVPTGSGEITPDNISSLNGKRIGVAKGSIQEDIFKNWADMHGVDAELIGLKTSEEESLQLVGSAIDAFVTVDVYGSLDIAEPVWKIGSSEFYFAVSKQRPELLAELDAALSRIQDENKYYDQLLHDKYLKGRETNRYFTREEKEWLAGHGAIRIGYQDNYLAFCAKDPSTGELTGALRVYLDYAATAFENGELEFEPVCYPTAGAAIEAMKNGEVDCVFPANMTDYDAEQLDLVMTPSLMRTEMDAVVRSSEQKEFVRKQDVAVAVNEGNTNYDMFLADHYPGWERKYYVDTPTGLEAVAKGEADCVIISNYRYNNISKQCEKLHLATVYTGVDMDYCFAVQSGEAQLYSILSRVTGVVPGSVVHTALTYYSTEDVKTSVGDLLRENLLVVLAVISLVLLVILAQVLRGIRRERKILEDEDLLKELNRRVFVDFLTSVRNKGAYSNYIQKLQQQLDKGEQVEFAIGMFDCNDLKLINDKHGHDKGDIYLKNACMLICKVFDHSPVFRIGGDEFAVVLQNDDFRNREQLMKRFEARQKETYVSAKNKWEEVHIACGIAVYDPEKDQSVEDAVRRADQIMYENKRMVKEKDATV